MKFKPAKLTPLLIAGVILLLVCFVHSIPHLFPQNGDHHRAGFNAVLRLEWMTYDWRVRLARHQQPPVSPRLGFVAIDDDSIETVSNGSIGFHYGLYWPRHLHGRLVRELKEQGAKAVALDVLFTGLRPDHDKAIATDDGRSVSSDEYFAEQIRHAGNVILASTKGIHVPDVFRTNSLRLGSVAVEKERDGILRRARAFYDETRLEWHPAILRLVRPLSLDLSRAQISDDAITIPRLDEEEPFEVPLMPDGSLDLVEITGDDPAVPEPPLQRVTERIWHLGIVLAAYDLGLDLANAEVDFARGRITLRGDEEAMTRVIPVDRNGYFYIDWCILLSDRRNLHQDSFEHLLAQSFERAAGRTNRAESAWKDRLVIIGSTATGNDLTDQGATSLESDTFLVCTYWNVANSVLLNRFIRESPNWVDLLIIVFLGAISAWLTWYLRAVWASFLVTFLGAAYIGFAAFVFVKYRVWLPVVMPVFGAMLMNHVGLVTYRAVFEQNERKRMRAIFSRMVSPEIVNEVLNADQLALGGARRELTVLFADVRGFTEFTDNSLARAEDYVCKLGLAQKEAEDYFDEQARETLATVNLYLGAIAQIVKKYQGTFDKYIGDCVMAFWGGPISNPRHALLCVQAAIEAQRAIDSLNRGRAEENLRREKENQARLAKQQFPLPMLALLQLGTGINTGKMMVGLMGSDTENVNYTVFGREVNIASRLEGVSGRSRIIISEATLTDIRLHDPHLAESCLELPSVSIKGIGRKIKIFEVPWNTKDKRKNADDFSGRTESAPANV